jgi:hypothetical protein
MRHANIFAAAMFAIAATAAQADPFEGLYDNTATSTGPDGKGYTYYINKDGTFEGHFPSGRTIKGTYAWKDAATACFTVTDPAPAAGENATNCRPFPETYHAGDSWTEKDAQGMTFTNTITAGRN